MLSDYAVLILIASALFVGFPDSYSDEFSGNLVLRDPKQIALLTHYTVLVCIANILCVESSEEDSFYDELSGNLAIFTEHESGTCCSLD